MKQINLFFSIFLFSFLCFGEVHEIIVHRNDKSTMQLIGMLDVLGAGIKDDYIYYRVHASRNELWQIPAHINIRSAQLTGGTFPEYSTMDEIDLRIEQIGADKNGYGSVFTIGESVEGAVIKAVRVSAVNEPDKDVPEILFVGLHHAREWISYEVPLSIAEFFMEYGETNPALNYILNNSVLWFIPALNPDGYVYSYTTDRMWRSNRRKHTDGTFGVDLNRNYDSSWLEIGFAHGTEPFSEPETRTVRDFIVSGEKFGVNRIDGLITYHSYGEMILYPPGSTNEPPENVELYQTVGLKMAELIANECGKYYNTMQIIDLYPTYGEMTEWFMNQSGNKLSYTFELRPSFFDYYGFELPPEFIQDTVKENIPAAIYFIQHIITGSTDIETDKNNDNIFDALENTKYDYKECYKIEPDNDIHDPVDTGGDDKENIPDEDESVSDSSNLNDDTVEEGVEYSKKSSGCSLSEI